MIYMYLSTFVSNFCPFLSKLILQGNIDNHKSVESGHPLRHDYGTIIGIKCTIKCTLILQVYKNIVSIVAPRCLHYYFCCLYFPEP